MVFMKSDWKSYKDLKYRRIKETEKAIYVEFTGGEGAYKKGEYSSDLEFVINAISISERLRKELNAQIESLGKLDKEELEKIKESNKAIFDRWQSEWGYDEEEDK